MWDSRTHALLGEENMLRLRKARVAVVGLGGVGGYAAEMLCRSSVGHMVIIDADEVELTNLNRQIIATRADLGALKTEVFSRRFKAINPDIDLEVHAEFLTPENIDELIPDDVDYVIDAIDTVAPKVALIEWCLRRKKNLISSMGAGGRLDPTKVVYRDIWETKDDGLAKAVRTRLKRAGWRRRVPVVCSEERPQSLSIVNVDSRNKRTSPGTIAAVPSTFGIFMAAYVINKIVKQQ